MIKFAITGGIATGKTVTLGMLKSLKIDTHNSDNMVRNIMFNDKDIKNKIRKIFPSAVDKNLIINRKKLSDIAFEKREKLEKLEEIFHPILCKFRRKLEKNARINYKKFICFEIPLLFEKNLENEFDVVILTHCSKSIQNQRALKRLNMNKNKLDKIKKLQINNIYKMKKADFLVNTGLGKSHSFFIIKNILSRVVFN